jgi:hypothetical protein
MPGVKLKTAADYASWFASRGGKARRDTMTPKERSESARKAARARWRGISRAERREIARKAVRARWRKLRESE